MLYDLGTAISGLVTISEPMTFRHLRQDGLAAASHGGATRRCGSTW